MCVCVCVWTRSVEACPSFLPLTGEPEDPRTDAHHLTAAPLLRDPTSCACECVRFTDGVFEHVLLSQDRNVCQSDARANLGIRQLECHGVCACFNQ